MYSFKVATQDDTEDLLRMCKSFFQFSEYSQYSDVDEDKVLETISWYLTQEPNKAVIFLLTFEDKPVGMLSLLSSPTPFWNAFIASEQVWWVDPEHRGRDSLKLMVIAEEWAKRTGCKGISFSCLESNSFVSKIYERKGYKLSEQNYYKEL